MASLKLPVTNSIATNTDIDADDAWVNGVLAQAEYINQNPDQFLANTDTANTEVESEALALV